MGHCDWESGRRTTPAQQRRPLGPIQPGWTNGGDGFVGQDCAGMGAAQWAACGRAPTRQPSELRGIQSGRPAGYHGIG